MTMDCSVRGGEGTSLAARMTSKAAMIDGAGRVAGDVMEDSAWGDSNR